jgi:ATP-dependent RNA helicase DeaD
LTIEGVVSWEFAPSFDAAHRAALESGKPLVYVCPPAGWALAPLLGRLAPSEAGLGILVLTAEPSVATDLAASLGDGGSLAPLHALTGAPRAERLLRRSAVHTLVCTPGDALQLARRAALKLTDLRQLVIAWPEAILALGDGPALDTLLAEAHQAQRLIVTTDDQDPALGDFLTRHAHRAPVVVAARLPLAPSGPARYVVVDDARRAAVARALLDHLDPDRVILWDPVPSRHADYAALARDPAVRVASDPGTEPAALAIAADLPSAEALAALRAVAREVVVLVRASQLPYLQRSAHPLRSLRVTSETDRAYDRAFVARRRVRERLAQGRLDAELLTLAPLFDEVDPALVAAALLSLPGGDAPVAVADEPAARVRLFVSAGRQDGVRPSDVVGALVNGVGIAKEAIGRVDIRDSFTLVDMRADEADRAAKGLNGATLRGRRVSARPDRR